jgi:hypothetical protein
LDLRESRTNSVRQTRDAANTRRVEDLEELGTLPSRIGSGGALLEIITYPWGVELNFRESEVSE